MGIGKEIIYSKDCRDKLVEGARKLNQAVCVTLGPKGRNVILNKYSTGARSTKDGVSVAREVFLTDTFENIGAQLLKQAATKAVELAGDGTTSATLLGYIMIREGMKAVTDGMNPMEVKKGIELAVDAVIKDIKSHSKPIDTPEEILQVARISANGNEEIAQTLYEAYMAIGKTGNITVGESRKLATTIDIVSGITINNGFLDPHFVNTQKNTCELQDCLIFFYEQSISKAEQLELLYKEAYKIGKPVLIIANELKGSALALMVENKKKGNYSSCAVMAPPYTKYRTQWMEDAALITGAKLIPLSTGARLDKNVDPSLFGTVEKVIVSNNKTVIVGGSGNKDKIKERKEELKKLLAEIDSSYEIDDEYRESVMSRLNLFQETAIVRVGGSTHLEMQEKYDLFEDANFAIRSALSDGVLPGGGVSLVRSADCLDELKVNSDSVNAGIEVVRKALFAPCTQIALNAGLTGIVENLADKPYNYGYNARAEIYGDMLEMGIIDPTKVICVALEGASSVAGTIIVTEAIISHVDEPAANVTQKTFTIPYE